LRILYDGYPHSSEGVFSFQGNFFVNVEHEASSRRHEASTEGISTCESDFYRLDTSEDAKESAIIKGPSVGASLCAGRGSLIFIFDIKGIKMGMVPNGYATTNDADLEFRLVSALELKRHGISLIGGAFEEPDVIECVRTQVSFETKSEGNLMLVKTKGKASDINLPKNSKPISTRSSKESYLHYSSSILMTVYHRGYTYPVRPFTGQAQRVGAC
jgi:hypothetical protein